MFSIILTMVIFERPIPLKHIAFVKRLVNLIILRNVFLSPRELKTKDLKFVGKPLLY